MHASQTNAGAAGDDDDNGTWIRGRISNKDSYIFSEIATPIGGSDPDMLPDSHFLPCD